MRSPSSATRRTTTTLAALSAAALVLLAGCSSSGSTNALGAGPSPAAATTTSAGAASPSAVPTSAPSPASAPSGTPTGTPAPGCQSRTVPAAVKAEVTAAYGHQNQPPLVHIKPRTGTFYYGTCDGTTYAAAEFEPTADATYAEKVASQDDGSAMKYFSRSANGSWTLIAGDGLPRDPRGCAAIRQIPARLAVLWGDCLAVP